MVSIVSTYLKRTRSAVMVPRVRNANTLFNWRREAQRADAATAPSSQAAGLCVGMIGRYTVIAAEAPGARGFWPQAAAGAFA